MLVAIDWRRERDSNHESDPPYLFEKSNELSTIEASAAIHISMRLDERFACDDIALDLSFGQQYRTEW
jgi:hypothetical protein